MTNMKYKKLPTNFVVAGFLCVMLLSLLPTLAVANEALIAALADGVASMNIRYRLEKVSENNELANGSAFTVRTRLGYRAAPYNGFDAYIEFENVSTAGLDHYNGSYSAIADPQGSEVNQLSLGYRGFDDFIIKIGRQRIIFDNARFIGSVDWRQNEQTFDALSIVNTSLAKFTLNYAYLTRVNTVAFTESAINSHIFNVNYSGLDLGELVLYGYFLDEKNSTTDSVTLGVRFKGSLDSDDGMKFLYAIEMAQQGDYADAANSFDVEYRFIEIGVKINGITAKLANESLAGNGDYAFETPLATKHAFNGWADQFLSTTAATAGSGLNNIIISVAGNHKGTEVSLLYHDFSADNGEALGTEIDFLALRKLSDYTLVGFKYAHYRADSWSVDTTKLWMWGQLKF